MKITVPTVDFIPFIKCDLPQGVGSQRGSKKSFSMHPEFFLLLNMFISVPFVKLSSLRKKHGNRSKNIVLMSGRNEIDQGF